MNTIKEWAEYYKRMGIWTFPLNQVSFVWREWRNKKKEEYDKEFEDYDWSKARKLLMVVGGAKRKRVFVINGLKERNYEYNNRLLKYALSELKLPSDYPWVIWDNNILAIIVDSMPDIIGRKCELYNKRVALRWEKSFTLPSPGSEAKFYYGQRPDSKIEQVDSNLLIKVAEEFYNKHIKAVVHSMQQNNTSKSVVDENMNTFSEETEKFFGTTFNKILNITIRCIAILGLLCCIAAYFTGLSDKINIYTLGFFILNLTIISYIIAAVVRFILWIKGRVLK